MTNLNSVLSSIVTALNHASLLKSFLAPTIEESGVQGSHVDPGDDARLKLRLALSPVTEASRCSARRKRRALTATACAFWVVRVGVLGRGGFLGSLEVISARDGTPQSPSTAATAPLRPETAAAREPGLGLLGAFRVFGGLPCRRASHLICLWSR